MVWYNKLRFLRKPLDLQNAANTQNIEVMGWTYDYGEEEPVEAIPTLPAFGVKGEW